MGRADVSSGGEDTIRLPAEPASAAVARQFVRDHLRRSNHGGLEDAAMLCVTELVANVSVHTDSKECVVSVHHAEDDVTIEVTDRAVDLPAVGPWSFDAEHGRGLRIVDALAGEWGVRRSADQTKSVWLRLCDS